MAFAEDDVGPVTVSPTMADTSAAEAKEAQSVPLPAGGSGGGEPVPGGDDEAEGDGSVTLLVFEPHAARPMTSNAAVASARVRTIRRGYPRFATDSNYRRS